MTDEPTHTPGPWAAALEPGCHGVVASIAGETVFVALITNDPESPEREPIRFANARLIAAAPEMKEALAAIYRRMDYPEHYDSVINSICKEILEPKP